MHDLFSDFSELVSNIESKTVKTLSGIFQNFFLFLTWYGREIIQIILKNVKLLRIICVINTASVGPKIGDKFSRKPVWVNQIFDHSKSLFDCWIGTTINGTIPIFLHFLLLLTLFWKYKSFILKMFRKLYKHFKNHFHKKNIFNKKYTLNIHIRSFKIKSKLIFHFLTSQTVNAQIFHLPYNETRTKHLKVHNLKDIVVRIGLGTKETIYISLRIHWI
jgi:hypothetical protein